MRWYNWVVLALGVWLIISPWILGYREFNLIVWNNVAIGSLVAIFALWNLSLPN